jgi:hypothetical protein
MIETILWCPPSDPKRGIYEFCVGLRSLKTHITILYYYFVTGMGVVRVRVFLQRLPRAQSQWCYKARMCCSVNVM